MYLSIPYDSVDLNNIFIGNKKQNNILKTCYFSNIYYSNSKFSLNNIVIHFNIHHIHKYELINDVLHAYFLNDDKFINYQTFSILSKIEENILNQYKSIYPNRTIQNNIFQLFHKKCIRLSSMKKYNNIKNTTTNDNFVDISTNTNNNTNNNTITSPSNDSNIINNITSTSNDSNIINKKLNDNTIKCIIRISGIWENENQKIGLIYKFMYV